MFENRTHITSLKSLNVDRENHNHKEWHCKFFLLYLGLFTQLFPVKNKGIFPNDWPKNFQFCQHTEQFSIIDWTRTISQNCKNITVTCSMIVNSLKFLKYTHYDKITRTTVTWPSKIKWFVSWLYLNMIETFILELFNCHG